MSTQVAVAEALLGLVPEAAALVAELVGGAPSGLQGQLMELLEQRGFAAETTMLRDASKAREGVWLQRFVQDIDAMKDVRVAKMLAEAAPVQLTRAQATRLDELADFVATLDLNDGGAIHLLREPDEVLQQLIDVSIVLFGFDQSVLALPRRRPRRRQVPLPPCRRFR